MLQVVNLTLQRQDKLLFNNLNFVVKRGEILQVLGKNGSGKSSLLMVLASLLLFDSGSVLWDSKVCLQGDKGNTSTYLKDIIYVGHQPPLQPYLSPVENLQLLLAIFKADFSLSFITKILTKLSLSKMIDTPCEQLSKGQCQRVNLARLELQKGKLWILDEPFSTLDEYGIVYLQNLLLSHVSSGGMVVMAT
ncbi:MAG: heme ABC exporter ATP-binding protein CcmA, partial [Romboutsia sp.]|nr:heme ABC exporter ATP-binding protein CcmA [Romboutsia sp.]